MSELDKKRIEDMLHNLIDHVRDLTVSGNEYNMDTLIKDSINTIEAALTSQSEQCKYGNETKTCQLFPMDCQCLLDTTFAQGEHK